MSERKIKLRNNAHTVDYKEAYEKTKKYDHLLKLHNKDFEEYINSMSGALSYFAKQGTNPFIASPEQARAIYSTAKRIGIIASAGSGKTTTMLRKLYLNRTMFDWKERDVLAITYTNGAAKNMRDSYIKMVSHQVNPQIIAFKTIHKYGKEFIEIANPSIQLISEDKPLTERHYDSNLEEYVEHDTSIYSLIRRSMKLNGVDVYQVTTNQILGALSVLSEKMLTSEEEFRGTEAFVNFPIGFDKLMEIKKSYTEEKTSKGCMDYVDMLETIHLIVSSVESTSIIQDDRLRRHLEYKAIYLDEAQDVSPLQISIIENLLRLNPDCQLVAVGDDDQSIFGFRGANPDYLVNIQDQYTIGEDGKEPLEIIYMTQNRRSSPIIVNSTNRLIANNINRYDKEAKAFNSNLDGNIEIMQDLDGSISSKIIVRKAKELYRKYQSAKDMAVLYREHSQVKKVLNLLIQERIPFNMSNMPSDSVLIHKHFLVQDIIGIMQMLQDLKSPYNIENYLHKLCPYLGANFSKTVAEDMVAENSKPLNERKKLSDILKSRGKSASNSIILTGYREVHGSENRKDNYDLINTIYGFYRTAYLDWYLSKNPEQAEGCDEALEYLLSRESIGYQGLKNEILDDTQWTNTHYNFTLGVKLRTFHTSKGLEWKDVFLLPISNKVSPKLSILNKFSEKDKMNYIEEERRLFYVACTRAISNLNVFYEQDSPEDKNMFIEEFKKAVAETKLELEALDVRKKVEAEIEPIKKEEDLPENKEDSGKGIIPMPSYN